MRKKKWAEPWIEEHRDFVYQNPVENKGKWKELLQRDTLHLEIGTGRGGLQEWFATGEVDVIHLNFSDPWPKKGNHKRRLSSTKFLEMYRDILTEDGYIRMKTDNKDLFEDSVLYFLQNDFTLTEFSVDFRRVEHAEDVITEYETRFMELGQPIYQLCAKPCRHK